MKPPGITTLFTAGLVLSLLVNVLLLGQLTQRPDHESPPVISGSEVSNQQPSGAEAPEGSEEPIGADAKVFYADAWRDLLTREGSKRSFANRLSREGMPVHLIKSLIGAQLAIEFDQRQADATYPAGLPYWKRFTSPEADANATKVREEFDAEMKDAFADLPPRSSSAINERRLELNVGSMPKESAERVGRIETDYRQLRQELNSRRLTREEVRLQSAALRRAREEDLVAVLTPEELRDYELRSSETALELMSTVAEIDLAEAEYEQLFDLNKDWERIYRYDVDEDISTHERVTAQFELYEDVVALLGNERGAQYISKTNPVFRELQALLVDSAVGAPHEIALTAWKTYSEIYATANESSDPSLLMNQLDVELRKHLDEPAFSRYERVLRARMVARLRR